MCIPAIGDSEKWTFTQQVSRLINLYIDAFNQQSVLKGCTYDACMTGDHVCEPKTMTLWKTQ